LRAPLPPDKETVKKWLLRLKGNSLHGVVVSHSHFDHCLDAPYFARETGALLVGSESTLNAGRGAGLTGKYLRKAVPGETINIGTFAIKFIESIHGPAFLGRVPYPGEIDKPLIPPRPARDYKLGDTYAIMISHPSGTVVHHGSAGFIPGMYEGIKADVVLLGIAGRGDTEAYLQNVPLKLGAKLIIPIHFDNFFIPLEKKMKNLPGVRLNEFLAKAEKHRDGFSLKVPSIGQKEVILPLKTE
jgi:L-ascorbate metabolism protein UlaG (beta-lactamase superfamily)